MLTEIRCDKFAADHQTVSFRKGLNTVLGSSNGSNALGKSTFLWIIDYAFGGDSYCGSGSDIRQNIGDHTVFFTFCFDGENHHFSRSTLAPKTVCRCDKAGHLIEKLSLDEYRRFLVSMYHPGVPFDEITDHFFRIYGRNNTYEKLPLHTKPREADEKAVDFLMKLFGKATVLNAIRALEDELGIKANLWKTDKKQPKSFEKIEENELTISALKERLSSLMAQDGSKGMEYLGFDTGTFAQLSKMQAELRKLTRRRNQLASRLDVIRSGNRDFINDAVKGDFAELEEFFPGINLKALEEIEVFHSQIRTILKEEMEEEVSSLTELIARCDTEIRKLKDKIESSGIASEISQRVLSQCVSVSKRIDELEAENRELQHEKEFQEARRAAERRMEKLIDEQRSAIAAITSQINEKMAQMNTNVTSGTENPPVLSISPQKEIAFSTLGNTSQGTACKSMVLYDLAILLLTNVPALIHDGNILSSISTDHLEKVLEIYNKFGKQVFIAVDKAESEILRDSAVLRLSEGHELYGFSWSRKTHNTAAE